MTATNRIQAVAAPHMPPRIAALPRHRGLPVPAMVQYDIHGVPDFKVIDMAKWTALVRSRGCGICGAKMGARVWFVAGPKSIEARIFTDLPMHEDCAEFALRTCPFLALPRFRYIQALVKVEGVQINVNEHVSTQRPDRFGLARSSGYRVVVIEGGSGIPMLQAAPFSEVQWWREGQRVA